MNPHNEDTGLYTLRQLSFWFLSAVTAGAAGTSVVYLFTRLYSIISLFLLSKTGIPLIIIPSMGALAVGLIIYRIEPRSMGEGIPSYLESLRERNGDLAFKETFFKFCAALLTLGTFGNGGFIGPVGRVSAGIMSFLGKFLSGRIMKRSYLHLYTICGLSAAMGALIGSPVGAGIFAVEIIQKTDMKYRDLFPSIISSSASVFFSRICGLEPIINFETIHRHFDVRISGWLLLIALTAGLAGYGYIKLYETVSVLIHRDHSHKNLIIVLKLLTGSILASLIAFSVNINIGGTSPGLFDAVFSYDIDILYGRLSPAVPLFAAVLVLIVLKATANCLTVGSGLSAGFTGPAMLMGLLIGTGFISVAGINPDTPEFYAFLAAGFAGMLASTMNTPVAAAVITMELFGFAYSLPAGIASIIGFQVNRNNTLYDFTVRERQEEFE